MADAKDDKNNEEKEQKGGLSTVKIVIIAVVLILVLVGGAVGTTIFFLGGDKASSQKEHVTKTDATAADAEEADAAPDVQKGPIIYVSLDPRFVVSFSEENPVRFMQFSVDLLMHNSDVKDQIKVHMPAIRSSLLMLFGDQKASVVVTKAGKEKLLQDITSNVNATLKKMEGSKAIPDGVQDAYFNSFVMQ